jgi:hypothetical protein
MMKGVFHLENEPLQDDWIVADVRYGQEDTLELNMVALGPLWFNFCIMFDISCKTQQASSALKTFYT